MPQKKRAGWTQVNVELPDELLAAVKAKKGGPLATRIAVLLAKWAGVDYTPPRRGPRPKDGPAAS